MFNQKSKIVIVGVILTANLVLPMAFFASALQPTQTPTKTAKFTLAYWSYPSDEYGQGITYVEVYQNSTGSWLPIRFMTYSTSANQTIDVPIGCAIKLFVRTWQNSTLTGATSLADMGNYTRLTATVTNNRNSSFSYSSGNFSVYGHSYYGGISSEIWMTDYEAILNFITQASTIYTAAVTFETATFSDQMVHYGNTVSNIVFDSHSPAVTDNYGCKSVNGAIETWIDLNSIGDEYVIYKWYLGNMNNSDGRYVIKITYKVENTQFGFYCKVYYSDSSYDDVIPAFGTSTSYVTISFTPDSGKLLNRLQLYSNDNPNTVASGNYSTYIDKMWVYDPTNTTWGLVATLPLYFVVPIAASAIWALNGWYIVLGAGMVVFSTCFAAIKIKSREGGKDDILLFLVLFIFGWCLIIGSVI